LDWFFFVDKETGVLGFIAMSGGHGLLTAKFASFDEGRPDEDMYWEKCSQDDFDEIVSLQYDAYLYDIDSESEKDMDFVLPIDWEIPLVQRWVKGEVPTLKEVQEVSFLLSIPDDFPMAGYVNGQLAKVPRATTKGMPDGQWENYI